MINLKRTPETLNESGLVDVMRVSSGGAGTNGLRPSLMIGPGTNRLRPSPCPLTDQQVSALPVSPGFLLPPPQGPWLVGPRHSPLDGACGERQQPVAARSPLRSASVGHRRRVGGSVRVDGLSGFVPAFVGRRVFVDDGRGAVLVGDVQGVVRDARRRARAGTRRDDGRVRRGGEGGRNGDEGGGDQDDG